MNDLKEAKAKIAELEQQLTNERSESDKLREKLFEREEKVAKLSADAPQAPTHETVAQRLLEPMAQTWMSNPTVENMTNIAKWVLRS